MLSTGKDGQAEGRTAQPLRAPERGDIGLCSDGSAILQLGLSAHSTNSSSTRLSPAPA